MTLPLKHAPASPALPTPLPKPGCMFRLSGPAFAQSLEMQRSQGAQGLTDGNSSTSTQCPAFSDTVIKCSLLWFNGNCHLQSDILPLTTSLMMKIKVMKIQTSNKLTSTLLKGLECVNEVMAAASPHLGTQGSGRDDQVLQHSAATLLQGISINMKSIFLRGSLNFTFEVSSPQPCADLAAWAGIPWS